MIIYYFSFEGFFVKLIYLEIIFDKDILVM